MTKKHIIIGIIIIIVAIVIWKVFFSKKAITKNITALATDHTCVKMKAQWPGLKEQITDDKLASWSDSDLTDFVYGVYGALHKLGVAKDVVLTGTMTRQERIDAIHKLIAIEDQYVQTC